MEYPVRQCTRPTADRSDLASAVSVGVSADTRTALHCDGVLSSLDGIS
ncbi:hypothetical protein [Pigmentiphaga litoralis]